MDQTERRLRAVVATALRASAHDLVCAWTANTGVRQPGTNEHPLELLTVDQVTACLETIAAGLEDPEAPSPVESIRSCAASLARHRRSLGADVPELLAEYDELVGRLQRLLLETVSGIDFEVDPCVVATVVGAAKDAFARFGVETAVSFRIYEAREARGRAERTVTFAEMMRHELRNQLGSASTAADLLREDEIEPERRKRLAELISRSLVRGLNTVEVVRSVIAGEANESEGADWLPLADIVQGIAGAGLDATPQVELDVDELPDVLVPGARVSMVLLNLVDNARKYHGAEKGDDRRWVRIGAEVDDGASSGSGRVRVSVSDNGRGIEPELQESIFEFAARGNGTEPGSGLGLALSRDVVHQLGGEIELESAPGEGTRVSFVIPARVPAASART